MRLALSDYLLWLLLLTARSAVGQGGSIGIMPGTGAPAPSTRPDILVTPSKGVAVAGNPPAGTGLRATYWTGALRGPAAYSRVEPGVGVAWRGAPPAPGIPGQGFSVRWTGYVRAPETGVFVLRTEWDDATDIRFAGVSVIEMENNEIRMFDNFNPGGDHSFVPVESVQYFTAGHFYRIELAYKNIQGAVSRALLAWQRPTELGHPTMMEQAFHETKRHRYVRIPQEFLYPELPPPPAPVVAAAAAAAVAKRRPVAPARPRRVVAPAVARSRPAPRPVAAPPLPVLERGTAVALPSLYFTQSTADLLPTSRPTLDALARELRRHPALRLEIAGHTDNVGEASQNLRLSRQRAQVVRRYLVQQGIDSLRLTARGYGGTRPVANNNDPQQRPRNRRVEVVVQ